MAWLNYSDDEVAIFHPVFQDSAEEALSLGNLDSQFEWRHHERTPGNRLVPDFVLCEKGAGRWRLALEVKRTRPSIHSTRNQIQAKSYAEEHADLFQPGAPKYFSISNLEQTILFALRDDGPPVGECRLKDGNYEVGSLPDFLEAEFRARLTNQLRAICVRVTGNAVPEFDYVWPRVLSDFIQRSGLLPGPPLLEEPNTPCWDLVRDYFCHSLEMDSARIFLFRCLVAEYLRGTLERFKHPEVNRLINIKGTPAAEIGASLSNVFSRLRDVDFRSLFDDATLAVYRNLKEPATRKQLAAYVSSIIKPPLVVGELARTRLDRSEFLDGILSASHRDLELDEAGKVTTDPELASLLAHIAIGTAASQVLDPCCGDGALLESAYDRSRALGLSHYDALGCLHGIEADPVLAHLTTLRILLREPRAIRKDAAVDVLCGDLFAHAAQLHDVDVVLMNPPFKRYEAQDARPVPAELRQYYASAISEIDGECVASRGQQNLYTYYVEFILRAAKTGCRFGVILDNKWYHNQYGEPLKQLLLQSCEIEALIEYPYSNLFADWTIATSVLICRKRGSAVPGHTVKFLRCSRELAQVDPVQVAKHFPSDIGALPGWSSREIKQSDLKADYGWKSYFEDELTFDFRAGLSSLGQLFRFERRGSLAKEEGGMSPCAFPFSRQTFGYVRRAAKNGTPYQTKRVRKLSSKENSRLAKLASDIPKSLRGYAVENPGRLNSYVLTEGQLLKQPTIEPASLRGLAMFRGKRKTAWTANHQRAVADMYKDPGTRTFIKTFRKLTGLNRKVMPDKRLWVGLREPYAGELIIPRKLRGGHRVHVNPYACSPNKRQVRVSSNFVYFYDCLAIDEETGLDHLSATKLIAAFLVSAFGQLQFEMKGYNREGLLSLEMHHLEEVRVVDPRTIPREDRYRILVIFDSLPYPIPMNVGPSGLGDERRQLDEVFAQFFCSRYPGWSENALIAEVYQLLDEYLLARSA